MATRADRLVHDNSDASAAGLSPPRQGADLFPRAESRSGGGGGAGGGGGGGGGGGYGAGGGDGGSSFLPDPGMLWLAFRRRIWLFLAVVIAVLGLVAAFTLTRPVLYTASASVLIELQQPEVLTSDPVAPERVSDTNVIDTEVEILSSRRLAGRVAEALKLETWPEFARIKAQPQPGDGPGTHPLAGAVLSRMDIRRSGLTYLIDITASAESPKLAAALANEYARQYLAQQQEMKSSTSEGAQEFLQTRLVELRSNAAQADAALQSYMIRNGLMSAEGATMAEQEVSVLNQEISAARAALAEKEGQLAAARTRTSRPGGAGGAEVPAALQSATVAQLRAREAELTGEVARLEGRLGDQHPELRRARGELADIRSQVQQQINRVMSSLEADVQAARSRVASLEASQGRARGSLASNSAAQAGYLQLERDAKAARQIYDTFLERAQDVEAQSGLIRPDASIETLAREPVMPSSPSYLLAAVAGVTAALIFGLIAVAVAEYLDARIRTRADVERRLGLAYLGAIPELGSTTKRRVRDEAPEAYLLAHPQSQFTEAVRALKNAILLQPGGAPRSVAVTSALPREGKSTTSICLARMLADSGLRTVLVDCDSRRRAVSSALLPEDWDGFGEYLRREVPLARALAIDEVSGMAVLGSRMADLDGRELFVGLPLAEMLAELTLQFEIVVIDTAPVLGVAETRLIAAGVESTLMLARWRDTSIKAAETAADLLVAADADVVGVALTRVDVRQYGSTGQQDVYSYQDKFAGYYVD